MANRLNMVCPVCKRTAIMETEQDLDSISMGEQSTNSTPTRFCARCIVCSEYSGLKAMGYNTSDSTILEEIRKERSEGLDWQGEMPDNHIQFDPILLEKFDKLYLAECNREREMDMTESERRVG